MKKPHGLGHRPDIDGLRAVAVLAVIGYHSFPELAPGGFVGVDVFFVISGFLITSIIVRELRPGTFSVRAFYARRARRILPALIVLLCACLAFGWIALLPDELRSLSKHVTAASVFVSNLLLWQERGYFDAASETKPLLHLWSLGIEEQFYLVWPLLLLLLWKRGRNLWWGVLSLVLLSFALNVALVHDKPTGTFYVPLTRFWEIGLGCLLALVAMREADRGIAQDPARPQSAAARWIVRLRAALPAVGLALIVTASLAIDKHTPFPGWGALLPTLGAVCVIVAGPDSWINRRVLAFPALVLIGLMSYSLYLWHWPLLSFAVILESGTPAPAVRLGAVLLGLGLAWISYRFVETPFRVSRAPRIPLKLAGGLAGLAVIGVALTLSAPLRGGSDYELRMLERGPRWDASCAAILGERPPFDYCRSNAPAAPDLIVLGDSHAQAIYDGAVAHLGTHHNIMLLGDAACPPLLNTDVYTADVGVSARTRCRNSWNTFVKLVHRARPSAVILVGRGSYYFEGETFTIERDELRPEQRREAFKRGLAEVIRQFGKTSRVFYVLEHPFFESKPHCFMRPFVLTHAHKCAPILPRAVVERRMASYRELVRALDAEIPELTIIDPLPLFCDSRYCYQQQPGAAVLYSDTDHLNPTGGRYLVAHSGLLQYIDRLLQASDGASRIGGAQR